MRSEVGGRETMALVSGRNSFLLNRTGNTLESFDHRNDVLKASSAGELKVDYRALGENQGSN